MDPKYYGAAAEYNRATGPGPGVGRKVLMIAGLVVGVLILLGVAYGVISSISAAPTQDFDTLAARASTLQGVIDKQKTNIQSGDLRTANTTADVLFLGNVTELNGLVKSAYGQDQVPDSVAQAEADTTADQLTQAKLAGNFDQTYVSVLQDKLAALMAQAKKVAGETSSNSVKDAITRLETNITAVSSALGKIQL